MTRWTARNVIKALAKQFFIICERSEFLVRPTFRAHNRSLARFYLTENKAISQWLAEGGGRIAIGGPLFCAVKRNIQNIITRLMCRADALRGADIYL